jgi:hypothetical protein
VRRSPPCGDGRSPSIDPKADRALLSIQVRLAVAALQAAAKGRCIGPKYPVELPLAQQFSNRPDHREFLRTALVLLGGAAHSQPQLGAFAGMTRPTVLAHSDAGIAVHTNLPE